MKLYYVIGAKGKRRRRDTLGIILGDHHRWLETTSDQPLVGLSIPMRTLSNIIFIFIIMIVTIIMAAVAAPIRERTPPRPPPPGHLRHVRAHVGTSFSRMLCARYICIYKVRYSISIVSCSMFNDISSFLDIIEEAKLSSSFSLVDFVLSI